MKVEQAKQIASNAIEQLRQALEAGHSERLKEYLAAIARFRRYSLGNVMLIASQKPGSLDLLTESTATDAQSASQSTPTKHTASEISRSRPVRPRVTERLSKSHPTQAARGKR